MNRREFLTTPLAITSGRLLAQTWQEPASNSRVRLALNSYSFNEPLSAGTMALADVVEYCSVHGIDALDATGYYFP